MWQCAKFTLDTKKPLIMGIVNVTPDSFSDGGRLFDTQAACAHARKLAAQGAAIIDVGGESTRPGSQEVSLQEELNRVLPVVTQLASEGLIVSIDTRHAAVAQACLNAGAAIINDVSGFRHPAMVDLAATSTAGLIIMHMLGEPKSMQSNPHYHNVVQEVSAYLTAQAATLEAAGVAPSRISIDPGPGFGKTYAHNLALLKATPQLAALGYPLVAGWSRKAFIGQLTGVPAAADRVAGSVAVALYAANHGARILRVHDVAPTAQALAALEPLAPRRAYIALGSNQGDSAATIKKAADKIGLIAGIKVSRLSGVYQSLPAYVTDQELFCNAVMEVLTTLEPLELLVALQGIEDDFGRTRDVVNGPRTLDLDIIDYQGVVSDDPQLLLPHPLALERDFVVTPLLQIAPGHVLADGCAVTRQDIAYGQVVAWQGGEIQDPPAAPAGDVAPAVSVASQPAAGKSSKSPPQAGGMLSICATPIGNLGDITQRVIEALTEADLVLAEDTRITRRLLSHLNLRPTLERCDENTIRQKTPGIITRIQQKAKVVLVSDAGMPGVSDPGAVLVEAALAAGCPVQILPGASAVLTAVVASGFVAQAFYFGGFLPRRQSQIQALLQQLSGLDAALVFFESPHRVAASLAVIAQVFPTRQVALARELTKLHEEVLRDEAPKLAQQIAQRAQEKTGLKGEITLVIGPEQKERKTRVHQDRYAAKGVE